VGVKVTLTNPTGARFGVCSTCFNCLSNPACANGACPEQCREPPAGGSLTFYLQAYDDCGPDDSHYQVVRVYYISGDTTSCDSWKLDIFGNQTADNNRSCGADD
jgi:hypothetical protein